MSLACPDAQLGRMARHLAGLNDVTISAQLFLAMFSHLSDADREALLRSFEANALGAVG